MKIPTCPLRKPCGWCKKDFGRKAKKENNKNHQIYLVSISVWNDIETCSPYCREMLHGARRRQRNAEMKALRERADKKMNAFLYPGVSKC